MTIKNLRITQLLLIAIGFAVVFVFWDKIPDQIPVHYNASGVATKFNSKFREVFFAPVGDLAMFFFFIALPFVAPGYRREPYTLGFAIFATITIASNLFTFTTFWMRHVGIISSDSEIIVYLIPITVMVSGNFMGKLRPNYYFGIRTPWALNNEEVWNRTHRFTGYLWFVCSLFVLVTAIVSHAIFEVVFPYYFLIIFAIPIIYSYYIHRKLKHTNNTPQQLNNLIS